jgi:hypothetical protein
MGDGKKVNAIRGLDLIGEGSDQDLTRVQKVKADLAAFKHLQDLYASAQDIGGIENVREHLSDLVEPFDREIEAILSVAGSRVANSESLANIIAGVAPSKMKTQISVGVEAAEPASALWGFGVAWQRATQAHQDDQNESTPDVLFEMALSAALASNDVAETGRLLLAKDVGKLRVKARNLPAKLLRQPAFGRPVLDVAVGTGAVGVAMFLFEFLRAKPTRETLKMTLSSAASSWFGSSGSG